MFSSKTPQQLKPRESWLVPDCETSSPTSLIPSKTTDAAVSEERMGKMGKMGKGDILCHTLAMEN